MRNLLTLIISLFISILSASANPSAVSDANIGGHVIDAENGDHIPGCVVKIIGPNFATMTDGSGHYVFRDLTPGEYTLEVSFIGYSPQKKSTKVASNQTV